MLVSQREEAENEKDATVTIPSEPALFYILKDFVIGPKNLQVSTVQRSIESICHQVSELVKSVVHHEHYRRWTGCHGSRNRAQSPTK